MQWVFYHEFHHVWSGHLRLFQALGPDSGRVVRFAEEEPVEVFGVDGGSNSVSFEHRRLRRLIEYDADKRAARRMVHPLTDDFVMLNAVKLDEAEKARLPGAWALMLGTLFLLLNPRPSEDIRAEDREYPHPEVRFWGAFTAFADKLSTAQTASFHEGIRRTLKLLNRLWRASAGGGDCYSNSRTRVEEVVGEANRLAAAVNQELYPRLFPYDVDQLLAARMPASPGMAQ